MSFERFEGEIFYQSKDKAEMFELANSVRENFERIWVCIHSSTQHDEYGLGITNEWGLKVSPDLRQNLDDFLKKNVN
jgi:hypothetical protein